MGVPFTDLMINSIANTHLNDGPGAIIALPDETFGLTLSLAMIDALK
jgi:hypothetical protein